MDNREQTSPAQGENTCGYTVDELLAQMEPQYQAYKNTMRQCIAGLTEHAARLAAQGQEEQLPTFRRLLTDIHNYSIDEVLMDVTNYLDTYKLNARELASRIIADVLETTGITATAGIGTNLYLCKVAMDIVAKHIHPDVNGVRIAKLDERTYRRLLWEHRPLTDFWRVGGGYARKLEAHGIYTMGDVARCSLENEELLYQLFGVNAELLIDHSWGWEPVTMADIKAYTPESKSIGSGQVLQCPYGYDKARLVVREMADQLALDLVDKCFIVSFPV